MENSREHVELEASILNEIRMVRNNLQESLKKCIVKQEEAMDADNWFSNQLSLLKCQRDKEIYISNIDGDTKYFSLFEKNTSFNVLPKVDLGVFPKESVSFFLETSEVNTKVSIVLIEYSDYEKIHTTFIPANKEEVVELQDKTKFIRLAIRIQGRGFCLIKNLLINSAKKIVSNSDKNYKAPKYINNLKVACILDDFSKQCFEKEVDLIEIDPDTWESILTRQNPDLLLVESAWHGNEKAWQYRIGKYSGYSNDELINLVNWCKKRNIPTVFWNKEDPFHFDKFIDSAKHFDYIYTTDSSMLPKYKSKVKHCNVFPMSFAAQPDKHNPIKIYKERLNKVCFAGTYYANRHEERRRDMDVLLDVSDKVGLDIYDRNLYRTEPEFEYPDKFKKNIVGNLPYNRIEFAYKRYKYLMNVNSVKNSNTMFSRRVFEGMACGTPIISNSSKGIDNLFGMLVLSSDDSDRLLKEVDFLQKNPREYDRKSLLGIREIYDHHTYKHRLESICKDTNIPLIKKENSITLFSFAKSYEECNEIIKIFKTQSYKNKRLHIYISQFEGFEEAINNLNSKEISIFLESYLVSYDDRQPLFFSDYLGYIDCRDIYGQNYIKDLMHAAEYSKADVIGKKNHFIFDKNNNEIVEFLENRSDEYTFVSELGNKAFIFKNSVNINAPISSFLEQFLNESIKIETGLFKVGAKIFSGDKYNYIKNGELADKKSINLQEFLF